MTTALAFADVLLQIAFERVAFDDAVFDLVGERDDVLPEGLDVVEGRGLAVVPVFSARVGPLPYRFTDLLDLVGVFVLAHARPPERNCAARPLPLERSVPATRPASTAFNTTPSRRTIPAKYRSVTNSNTPPRTP